MKNRLALFVSSHQLLISLALVPLALGLGRIITWNQVLIGLLGLALVNIGSSLGRQS